jgi:hypothetical protein
MVIVCTPEFRIYQKLSMGQLVNGGSLAFLNKTLSNVKLAAPKPIRSAL